MSATQYRMDSLRPFWDGVGAAALIPTPAFTPKFAAVLAGECDAALYLPIRPHRTAIWDYAAAAQLLSEAGGWFGAADGTDLLEALPFEYSGGWVAAPPSLRDQLLAVAQRYRDGPSARAHVIGAQRAPDAAACRESADQRALKRDTRDAPWGGEASIL